MSMALRMCADGLLWQAVVEKENDAQATDVKAADGG